MIAPEIASVPLTGHLDGEIRDGHHPMRSNFGATIGGMTRFWLTLSYQMAAQSKPSSAFCSFSLRKESSKTLAGLGSRRNGDPINCTNAALSGSVPIERPRSWRRG
jgi:hypothetical protein